MANLHNIEASAFRKGEYVGWRKSDGQPFNIRKSWNGWRAINRDATGAAGDILTARTLSLISIRLEQC